MEGSDANVYIALIGENQEAEKVWLSKQIAKSKNKNLFEAGQCDEFLIFAPNIKRLKKIRIGIDNTGFGAGWHLQKVECIDVGDGTRYLFECNRWLSKDEDDGKVERVLMADDDSVSESSIASSASSKSSSSTYSDIEKPKSKNSSLVPSKVNSTKSSRSNSPATKLKSTRLSGLEVGNMINKQVNFI